MCDTETLLLFLVFVLHKLAVRMSNLIDFAGRRKSANIFQGIYLENGVLVIATIGRRQSGGRNLGWHFLNHSALV